MLKLQKNLSNSFYVLLSLPATAMGFGLSVQIAVLSWILSSKYGLDIHEVGIVWAAGPLAGIIGQILIGILSDRVWFWGGRRRPFIIIGGVLAALMIYCLPRLEIIHDVLGIGSIMAVALTIALTLDLSINIGFNPTRSIIADVTPEGPSRTKGFTWMQAISNFFGAGAYLVSALIDNYVLMYLGIVLIVVFTIIPVIFIKEPKVIESEENESDSVSFLTILKTLTPLYGYLLLALYGIGYKLKMYEYNNIAFISLIGIGLLLMIITILRKEDIDNQEVSSERSFRKILAAHSFTWLGVQTMFVYAFFFFIHRLEPLEDKAGQMVGWAFFLLNAFGAFFPIYLLEPLSKRIGRVKTHILAVALMAAGFICIALFAHNNYIFYGLMIILSIGWSSLVSLPFAIMTERIKKTKMGLYMGIFNLSVVLPQLVASFIVGLYIMNYIEEFSGIGFWISGVSLGLSAIMWFFVKEKIKN